ncbi:dTDP-4-dehydrorhamnose reductase [uncultured Algimonas sp.]|uniref:dTDP-4-dehydrorhamnose reductase n=1 Tax=uncultured Algimonas sp. TaxID=1547920 RepID=UPI002609A07E|nr:dTDP-4-dehydrorhamnose reductase [uncultured Algimonas sp.]
MGPLVIGRTGQLARALDALLPNATCLGREALDLAGDGLAICKTLDAHGAASESGVILAAAYTDVDGAEEDRDTAHAVNAVAPGIIARWCAERGAPLVHVSTDYVFDGRAVSPYGPDHPTQPLNVYGRTKRDGETAIQDSGANAAILRTSWVHDGQGRNFLTSMLRLAAMRDTLRIVSDQTGRPTYAPDLARAAVAALETIATDPSTGGTYHVTNTGDPVSWAGFAAAIFDAAEKRMRIEPITTAEFGAPAPRPAYSVLDTEAFERGFGYALPDWRDGMRRALQEADLGAEGTS